MCPSDKSEGSATTICMYLLLYLVTYSYIYAIHSHAIWCSLNSFYIEQLRINVYVIDIARLHMKCVCSTLLPGCKVACNYRCTIDILRPGNTGLELLCTRYTARVGLVQPKDISAILLATR